MHLVGGLSRGENEEMKKFLSSFLASLFLGLYFAKPVMALCIQEDEAKLRDEPSTKSNIAWEGIRYMPLKKVSKQSGWYEVEDVDGKKHWIREDLVTNSYKCATIKDEYAYLRTGPGANFPKVKAEKGDKYLSFRLLGERNGFVKLEDQEGDEVWVAKKLVWID